MAQSLFSELAQQTLANISTDGPAEVGDDPVSAIYQVAQERGIDPANLLGLAKLETQAGAKTVKGGGADTRNLFNVKDFSNGNGGIRARDNAEGSNDRYRQYGSYRESAEDLVSLLERKYPGALKASSPEEFASELKRGGYATDPLYERKLASTIRSSGATRPAEPAQEWDQGARYIPMDLMLGTDQPKPAAKGEPEGIVSSMGNAVWQGAKSLGRSVMASGSTAVGDLTDVELLAAAQKQDARNDPQAMQALKSEIEVRKKANPGAKWWQALGDVGDAAWQNKLGTAQLIANQAPNSAVALGGGWAGGVAGAKLGALAAPFTGGLSVPVGATVGALAGMFLGNYAMESGGKAIEKAEGGFTQDEANASMTEGAKKAAVITGVDALTLGAGKMVGRTVFGAPVRAGARAEAQVLADAGVDITSKAAIAQALATNQALKQTAIEAGKQAAKGASKVGTRVAQAGTGMTMETLGEGTGEYFGEEWATGKGDIYDAALEALSSATQSVPQTAIAMAKSSSNELDPLGIVRAAKQSGGIVSRAGLAATPGAQQPNPAAPNQPATNPGAAAATVPAGNAGNTAAASTAPNPYFDGVTDEALANMGQFMATRQTMTDGTPITEADRQVGRDALAELQRRRLAAKANPQPAAAQTPTQASALSAIEQALEADKQRRRAAGEVVEDEVEEDDVVAAQPAATTAQPAAAPAAPIQPAVKPPLSDERDAMLPQAIDLLRQGVRPSVAAIQGQLRIGFNRAARILEEMERDGVVGPMDAQGARQILKLPDPPDAQATTPAQPASAGFSLPAFDNSPIPKMDPAAADEQRRQATEAQGRRRKRVAALRLGAYNKNPMMEFLGRHGLQPEEQNEFAPGNTERRKAAVYGYGPVFRKNGKPLDLLLANAQDEGFLPPDSSESDLRDLVSRTINGERVEPLYKAGIADDLMQRLAAEREAKEAASYEDYLREHGQAVESGDFDPLDSIGATGYDFGDDDLADYAASTPMLQAEVSALAQHYYDLGFDPDEVLERLSIETENQPEQAYYDRAKSRFTELIEQALSPGRRKGSTEQGGGGAVRRDAGQASAAQADGSAAGSQAAAVTPPAAPAAAQPRRADAIRAKLDDLKAQGFSQFTRSSGRTLLLNPDTYETVELTPAEMVVAKAASGQARAGLQSLRGQRKPAQVDQQGADVLQSYTPADVLIQEEQASQQQAADQAERDKAQAQARADDERKRIEQASYAAADSFELGQNPLDSLTGQKDIFGAAPVAQGLAGEKINDEWTTFDPQSGTLGIPRAQMPQIKAEHRGAMVNFLKARGIDGQQETIPSKAIKPTQAEFSPAKVKKAMDYQGGNRSIIVSADGYVVDGHHQWLAAREKGEPIPAIRLDQNIGDVLAALKDMPSAQPEQGAMADPVASLFDGKPDLRNSAPLQELDGFQVGEAVDVSSRTIGRSQIEVLFKRTTAGTTMDMARIVNGEGKKLDVLTGQMVKVEDASTAWPSEIETGDSLDVDAYRARKFGSDDSHGAQYGTFYAESEDGTSGYGGSATEVVKERVKANNVLVADSKRDALEQLFGKNSDEVGRWAEASDSAEEDAERVADEMIGPEALAQGYNAIVYPNDTNLYGNPTRSIHYVGGIKQKLKTEADPYPLVTHTTTKGKTLRGFIVRGMTLDGVKASIDPYALKKDGGVFVREQHKDKLPKPAASDKPAETPEPQGGQEKQATQSNANQQGQDDSGAQWSRMTSIDREAVALRAKMPKAAAAMWSKRGWDAIDSVIQEKLEKAMRRAETAIQPTSDAVEVEGMTQAEAQQALEAGQKLLHYDEEIWIDRAKTDAVDSYVIKSRYTDGPVVSTKGPAGPRGVQWGKSEAAKRAVESMGLPQERQPDSATPADDASENVKKLVELKQDLQALQQRIKEQGQVADDRLLERERKLSDVVKSLERDIQKAKLDQIPAASVPDDARNKALEAGKEMANSIFDWTGKSSGVAKVKVAVMDSLMAQGYFDDGVANLAKQIVEELRQRDAQARSQPAGRKGYDTPVELDAAQLKAILEQTRGEPLVDKPAKLEAWRNGTSKTDQAKFPIELVFRPDGKLDVNDGRHRIALAAERGEKVTAFIDGKDAKRAKDMLNAAPGTRFNGASERAAADRLDKLYAQMDGIMQRNTREAAAKSAVRSVIEGLRKPRTAISIVPMLDGAANGLDRQYGAMADAIREVADSLSGPAIQDFLDGKRDTAPTLEKVQAGTLDKLEKELADWQIRRELPINQGQIGVIDEEIAKLQAQVDALRGATGQEGKQPSIAANPDIEAIFDQLDGITQRTQAAGQQAAAEHPQAERIQFVQKHILDILEDLEDSGKVTINC